MSDFEGVNEKGCICMCLEMWDLKSLKMFDLKCTVIKVYNICDLDNNCAIQKTKKNYKVNKKVGKSMEKLSKPRRKI